MKDGSAEDYQGGRTASDIVRQGEDLAAENVPPPEVVQVSLPACLAALAFTNQHGENFLTSS